MPSPFPGMDPFLEQPAHWPAFHRQFVASLYQLLLPALVDTYRARVVTRNYVTELPLFTSVLREPHTEEYVEVRSRTDGRLVAVLDVTCPANKQTRPGTEAYLATRKHAEAARAAVVDIDLLTHGPRLIEFDRSTLAAYDQCITVTRSGAGNRYEVYTATVQKKLPKLRVPLAADDRDALIDLQDVFRRAYDQGAFLSKIDYKADLPAEVTLAADGRNWVHQFLVQQKLR
jgi:hypothetical protein